MNETAFLDNLIIEVVKDIFDEGDFVVETVNESVLVELMKKRGTPLVVSKSLRDTTLDYMEWLMDKVITNIDRIMEEFKG